MQRNNDLERKRENGSKGNGMNMKTYYDSEVERKINIMSQFDKKKKGVYSKLLNAHQFLDNV